MKRLLAGLVFGVALGSSGAVAAVKVLVVPAGTSAVVQPGRQFSTGLSFPRLDLSCTYSISVNVFGLEPKGSPLMFCHRTSVPGSSDLNAIQSRQVIVSRFRFYVLNNRGEVVYQVNRTP